MGVGRNNVYISDKEKLVTAVHEGGHALTSVMTQGSTPLNKVTILTRGSNKGYVISLL